MSQHNKAAVEVGEADFQSKVLVSKQPVLVAFWAPWSRPCQVLGSVLDEVAGACEGKATVVKVNADENPELSLWYDIQSIPSLLYFINGLPHARLVGTASKEAILAKLEAAFEGGDSTSAAKL